MYHEPFVFSKIFSFSVCTLSAGVPVSPYSTPPSWAISYCVIQWSLYSTNAHIQNRPLVCVLDSISQLAT